MRYLGISVALVVSLAFAAAVGGEERSKREEAFTAAMGADGIQRAEVIGGSYYFSPNHIIVRVNIPVELKVRKEPGIVPHNLVLKAPEAGIDIDESLESDPKVVRFTPTKTGSYPFYCDKKLLFFESHRDKGMEGVLEVTP